MHWLHARVSPNVPWITNDLRRRYAWVCSDIWMKEYFPAPSAAVTQFRALVNIQRITDIRWKFNFCSTVFSELPDIWDYICDTFSNKLYFVPWIGTSSFISIYRRSWLLRSCNFYCVTGTEDPHFSGCLKQWKSECFVI